MIFDTDIIIAAQRGNLRAAKHMSAQPVRRVSVISYIEFVLSAQNKAQLALSRNFFSRFSFEILPITPNISHKAVDLLERYGLSHGLLMADAFIAATAYEHGLPLATANDKDYKMIAGLELVKFRA